MLPIQVKLQAARRRRALRSARLPWAELEAEAARQQCSPADIFFDRAGRPHADLATVPHPSRPETARDAEGGTTAP